MPTATEKAAYLMQEGLVAELNGQVMFSTRAVALLTGTSEDVWHTPSSAPDDPFEVLYRLAGPRELRRNPETDEQLRDLDG